MQLNPLVEVQSTALCITVDQVSIDVADFDFDFVTSSRETESVTL